MAKRTHQAESNSTKRALTTKQVLYVSSRLEGKNKEQAMLDAGYSPKSATTHIEENQNLRAVLLDCMARRGLNEEFLANKLKKGLNARKTIYATKDGMISDIKKVEDNETQHKYFRDVLEIRGDIRSSVIDNLNVGLIACPTVADENKWNEESVTLTENVVSESKSSTENGNGK